MKFSKRLELNVPEWMQDALETYADRAGVSVGTVAAALLGEALEQVDAERWRIEPKAGVEVIIRAAQE